jgi:four helix bundle protein
MGASDGLKVCRAAQEFAEKVAALSRELPACAPAKLRGQLADAARSISANLAEGFGRGTRPQKIQYSRNAKGSLEEVQSYLRTCVNDHLIDKQRFYWFWNRSVVIARMLSRIIAKLERHLP